MRILQRLCIVMLSVTSPAALSGGYEQVNRHAVKTILGPAVKALSVASVALQSDMDRACATAPTAELVSHADQFEQHWWANGFAIGLPPLRYVTPPPAVFAAISKPELTVEDFAAMLSGELRGAEALPMRSRGVPAMHVAIHRAGENRCTVLSVLTRRMVDDLDAVRVALTDTAIRREWFEPDGDGEFFDDFDVTGALVGHMLDHWDWALARGACASIAEFSAHWRMLLHRRDGLGGLIGAGEGGVLEGAFAALDAQDAALPCGADWDVRARDTTRALLAALSALRLGSTFNARDGD